MNAPQIDPKTRSRLDKLKALAEGGIGGEAETAEKVLLKLLAAAGWTREQFNEIDSDPPEWERFPFHGTDLRIILAHIITIVLGKHGDVFVPPGRDKSKYLTAKATPRQKAEILVLYSIYRPAWTDAVHELRTAFVWRHGLILRAASSDDGAEDAPSQEAIRKARRIRALADGIVDVPRHKRLTGAR